MTYFTQFRKEDYLLSENVIKKVTKLTQYTRIFSRAADDLAFYTFYNAEPSERLDNISNKLYGTPDFYWTIPILNSDMINTWNDMPRSVPSLRETLERKHPGDALIATDRYFVAGNFVTGELAVYDNTDVYRILNIFPTSNYVQAQQTTIDVSELNSNVILNDSEYLIGVDSLSPVSIESVIPAYNAPAFFTDPDGNRVPSFVENAVPTTIEEVETELNESKGRLKVIRPEFIRDAVNEFEIEMKQARRLNE